MTNPHEQPGTSRRSVFKAAGLTAMAGMAATGAAQASAARQPDAAPEGGGVITRPVPSTGERVPAVGLGTFMTFDKRPGRSRENLRQVFERFWRAGGRVVDTSPLYGLSEVTVGDFAADLGVTNQLFLTNKIWGTGEYLGDFSHARRMLQQSGTRLWRERIDVVQVHSLVAVETNVPILRHFKKEGLIRFLGVTHHDPVYYPAIEFWLANGNLDFVQVHYSIQHRVVEERILPMAADRGVAVMVNMPLEKARLHKIVERHRLPGFAAEFGARNWAQFFLKYVISHPAVTVAIPATTNPDHLAENVGALRGPLPDERMRRRMVQHMETIPGFRELQDMPWYPGKTFDGLVTNPPVPPVQ